MGALTGFLWIVAGMVGLVAVAVVVGFILRARYIAAGQEEGE